jgi:hypothetical protein
LNNGLSCKAAKVKQMGLLFSREGIRHINKFQDPNDKTQMTRLKFQDPNSKTQIPRPKFQDSNSKIQGGQLSGLRIGTFQLSMMPGTNLCTDQRRSMGEFLIFVQTSADGVTQ